MTDRDEQGLQAQFWNEAGGRMWVENIERTHALIGPLGDEIRRRAAAAPGEAVLDIGCGGGQNTVEIAAEVGAGGRVLGVDVSEMILDWARAQPNLPDYVEFLCADAASHDFGAERFDLLFSRFGVMFFNDPSAAFANLRRSLKPGGRLAFLCWQAPQRNAWLSVPMGAIFEVMPPPEPQPDPRAPGPFAFADQEYVREILTGSGFREMGIESLELAMPMGPLDEAVDYMMRFGPAVEALAEATDAERAAVEAKIRDAFAPFVRDGIVTGPTATWVVTARV
jgi:SAM-dependent methyltransferase